MLNKLLLILMMLLLVFSVAEANDYDWVKAGSIGYLSTFSAPAVYFNARAGNHLLLAALPMDYSSMQGYCGLARMGNSTTIVSGFLSAYIYATAPIDDLYIFLCIKSSGSSGNILMVAADTVLMGSASVSAEDLGEKTEDPELLKSLQEEIDRIMGR